MQKASRSVTSTIRIRSCARSRSSDYRCSRTSDAARTVRRLEGRIYNPENGRTYRASLKLRSPDILEVKGCLLIVCDTQVWRRVESLCALRVRQCHRQVGPHGLNASTETLLTPNFLLAPCALSEMNW